MDAAGTDCFVRAARAEEAPAMARAQAAAWRSAYGEALPFALDEEAMAATWLEAVRQPPTPEHRVLVATESGAIVGLAAFAPAANGVELLALVVDPGHQRRGHGSRLLAAFADLARASGATEACTWIPIVDEPRRAFLLSAGWGPDGAYRDLGPAEPPWREVRLTCALA